VYTKDTGSWKQSYELELLQQQHQKAVSIFKCDYYDVFSDVVAWVGDEYWTIKVDDVANEFHVLKRKLEDGSEGSWVNTGMFKQVWKAAQGRTGLQKAEWVVKVDADTVFVPHRLKAALMGHPLTWTGIYFENCKEVEWGFYGNLEVYSLQAFKSLVANIDSCSQKIDWVKGTKWGPIGEDLFAQMCMDYQGVTKLENFDLTTDGMCYGTRKRWGEPGNVKWRPNCAWVSTPALHPFKKPWEWMSCYEATIALG
jgi:hypothetical protein